MKNNYKKLIVLLFTVIFMLSLISFTGCSKNYTVNFIVDGNVYATKTVSTNEIFAMPTNPQKENATFGGWYFDNTDYITEFTNLTYYNGEPDAEVINVYARFVNFWNGVSKSGSLRGVGTESNPYQINSPEDLKFVSAKIEEGETFYDKHFKLTADLNLGGNLWTPIGISSDYSFRGKFNGNNKTISNFMVNGTYSRSGLFGSVRGSIKNLTVSSAIINVNSSTEFETECGIVAGYINGNAENIFVSGQIVVNSNQQKAYVGALFGYISQTRVNNCVAKATIDCTTDNADCYVGGLIGYINAGKLNNCYSEGFVENNTSALQQNQTVSVGAFSGHGESSIIKNCKTKTVLQINLDNNVNSLYVGGFIANANANTFIDKCVSQSNITCDLLGYGSPVVANLGGLVGTLNNSYIFNSVSDTNIQTNFNFTHKLGFAVAEKLQSVCYNLFISNQVQFLTNLVPQSNNDIGKIVDSETLSNKNFYKKLNFFGFDFSSGLNTFWSYEIENIIKLKIENII